MPVPKGTRFFIVNRRRGKTRTRIRIAVDRSGKTIEAKKLPKNKKK